MKTVKDFMQLWGITEKSTRKKLNGEMKCFPKLKPVGFSEKDGKSKLYSDEDFEMAKKLQSEMPPRKKRGPKKISQKKKVEKKQVETKPVEKVVEQKVEDKKEQEEFDKTLEQIEKAKEKMESLFHYRISLWNGEHWIVKRCGLSLSSALEVARGFLEVGGDVCIRPY